jgi:hypothetical protein
MTEIDTATAQPPERKRRARLILYVLLGTLVFFAAAVFVASQVGLDKALVRQQLDRLAGQMRERGRAQGRDVEFTYSDITITGGLGDRHAVVHAPKLRIQPLDAKPRADGKPQSLQLTSPVLEIYPETSSLSAMKLALPQPITFASAEEPDKKLMTLSSATPLEVRYAHEKVEGALAAHWQFDAPKSYEVSYLREQRAEGAEDETPTLTPVYQTMHVTLEKGVGELAMLTGKNGQGTGSLEISNVAMAPGVAPEEGKVTIDQIVSHWSNQRNEKNLNVVTSSFAIDNVQADPELLPYAPISAAMDVTYEGAMPTSQEEQAAMQAQESAFKLKTFTLSTKDATFSATADFVATPEDRLPVGMANVSITNVPFIIGELKKYRLFDEQKEQVLAVLLQQVTGTPYGELKDVVIDVNRSRGGSFKIGESTFEELFASLLRASMGKTKPVPVPSIPDEKKAQPPVKAPEDANRG